MSKFGAPEKCIVAWLITLPLVSEIEYWGYSWLISLSTGNTLRLLLFFFAWRVFKRSNTKPFEAIAGNLKVRPLEPDPQIETKGPDKA